MIIHPGAENHYNQHTREGMEASKETKSVTPTETTPAVSDRLIDAINPDRSFTVFSHGTKHSRETEGTTIGDITAELKGTEYNDFLVLDGPGAKGKLPGSYAYNDLSREVSVDERMSTFGGKKVMGVPLGIGASEKLSRVADLATGTSAQHSAATAVSNILSENADGIPGVINMIGFSRGAAVTSSQIVDQLKQVFGERSPSDQRPRLQVNLFLIDPVAGGNKGDKHPNRLSQNQDTDNVHINSLFAVYSRDDEKATYTPQYPHRLDISDDVKTGYTEMAGRHTTQGMTSTTLKDLRGKEHAPNKPDDPLRSYLDGPSSLLKKYTMKFLEDRHPGLVEAPTTSQSSMVEEHQAMMNDPRYLQTKQSASKSPSDIAYSKVTGGFLPFKARTGDDQILSPQAFSEKLFEKPAPPAQQDVKTESLNGKSPPDR